MGLSFFHYRHRNRLQSRLIREKDEYRRLEIQNLHTKNIIEPTGNTNGDIISGIFLRDGKDGGHRMILNLKNLNEFTVKHHFQMETLISFFAYQTAYHVDHEYSLNI